MSIYDTIAIGSESEEFTRKIGKSLALSLYHPQTTIYLTGDLGAGKTTFVQGFGLGLGILEQITSPTFALENRFDDKLLHMDLYRLEKKEAQRITEETEEFPGVRVVEWSERLEDESESSIYIHLTDPTPTTRTITITFHDLPLPDDHQIEQWRKEMMLPKHIGIHCDAVADVCDELAKQLIISGTVVRKGALRKAARLHDLLRFVDFDPKVHSKIPHAQEINAETQKHWDAIKKKYIGSHEEACADFLIEKGYPELGTIIRTHGLSTIVDEPHQLQTIEQKLLFYADKRVQYDKKVSLDERFDDFVIRYCDGTETEWNKKARKRTKEMEEELTPL